MYICISSVILIKLQPTISIKQIVMSNPRYLPKSRFKLALDCETKFFYTNNM